jgi:hypothetical protein
VVPPALTPLPAPLPTVSGLPVVAVPADGESEGTHAATGTEASDVASSAAPDERADEDRLGGLGADGNGADPPDERADVYVGEGGDTAPPGADDPTAGASQASQPIVTMGTIRDPVRSSSWALRATPSTSARTLASLPRGTRIQILPDSASGGGFTWLRVRTPTGLVGWVVAGAVLR